MAKHIMFDVDGTLVQSYEFDEQLFIESVKEVTGLSINSDWASYPHVTDWGLLQTFCERQASSKKLDQWYPLIKELFIERVANYLASNPVAEVAGAVSFFEMVRDSSGYQVSLATGGWGETARLKLACAGFELAGTVLKSSDDHYAREEIMLAAATSSEVTYFGDGTWDKKACDHLGYHFVAVGKRVEHRYQIDDFSNPAYVQNLIENTK